jgi:hypothetical protein
MPVSLVNLRVEADGNRSLTITLPCEVGTQGATYQTGFNRQPLEGNVMDVRLAFASNKPPATGVPDRSCARSSHMFANPTPNPQKLALTPPIPAVPWHSPNLHRMQTELRLLAQFRSKH